MIHLVLCCGLAGHCSVTDILSLSFEFNGFYKLLLCVFVLEMNQ